MVDRRPFFEILLKAKIRSEAADAVDSMIKDMSNLKKDRDHLLLLLDIKDIDIQNLETKINELAHKSYIASTFTWS